MTLANPDAGALVRPECDADALAIDTVQRAAFLDHPFSAHDEHCIVQRLRRSGALSLSLVAVLESRVVGHVAFSPVTIGGRDLGWWGLGPLAVVPAQQRRGIGSALLRHALGQLRERGVAGCVVLGDPAYYARFGFAPRRGLVYPGPPVEHFMALPLAGADCPQGEVAYHAAFSGGA